MRTSEREYINDQLEPNNRLRVGKKKKFTPTWIEIGKCNEKFPPIEELTDEEKNQKSDEYLKKYGL